MRFSFPKNKLKNIALFFALAAFLCLAVVQVFFTEDKNEPTVGVSDLEKELAVLLNEIEGVGKADVMICQAEDGDVESVVVVCEGADDLLVLMNVREAVSAAVGTDEKAVKIYQKK